MSAIDLAVDVRGQGEPLLCLHGHPGSSRTMQVFTESLSATYRTIAPDLRGYGASRVSQPFNMTTHLDDLEHLLAQQGVERCILLGWSLGGILALELALRHPERYPAIVLIATAARPRGAHPKVGPVTLACTGIAALLNLIVPGWQWNIDVFGQRSLFRWLIHQPHPTPYQYLATQGTTAYFQTSRFTNQALQTELRQGYNRLSDIAQLSMPCLMLAGEHDVHITAASSQETAAHLPQCDYHCLPHTAHLLPWEQPQTVLKLITDWLAPQQG